MSRARSTLRIPRPLRLIVAGLILAFWIWGWARDWRTLKNLIPSSSKPLAEEKTATPRPHTSRPPHETSSQNNASATATSQTNSNRKATDPDPIQHADREPVPDGWTRLVGCTLLEDRYNDGDNILTRHPASAENQQAEESVFRLYFIDTPESRDKPYDDHHQRVEQQGRELGGLDYEETLALGQRAKTRSHQLLQAGPFTVWTRWQPVFDSERFFALIQLGNGDWLHEVLLREGLARVHTEGTDLPSGTPRRQAEAQLEALQQRAIRDRSRSR